LAQHGVYDFAHLALTIAGSTIFETNTIGMDEPVYFYFFLNTVRNFIE